MVAIQVVAQEPSPQASLQKERVVFELLRFEAPVGSAAQLIKRPILNSFLDTAKIISGQKPYKAAILDAKQTQDLVSQVDHFQGASNYIKIDTPRLLTILGKSGSLSFGTPSHADDLAFYQAPSLYHLIPKGFVAGQLEMTMMIETTDAICKPDHAMDTQEKTNTITQIDAIVEKNGAILIGGHYVFYNGDGRRVLLGS